MRISNVEALYLRLPEIKARTDSSQDALLIRITTDAGIIGWGNGMRLTAGRNPPRAPRGKKGRET